MHEITTCCTKKERLTYGPYKNEPMKCPKGRLVAVSVQNTRRKDKSQESQTRTHFHQHLNKPTEGNKN